MADYLSNNSLHKSLACAALHPGLRTILVFDAPYIGLQHLADILVPFLRETTSLPVRRYRLGPFATDDDVWGSLTLPGHTPIHRLFSPERSADEFQLIIVPDLSALSQVAARTCTMLIGADTAYLERYAQHQRWRLQQCWLVGCEREAIGRISPHVLDRFALRIAWKDIGPTRDDDEERAHQLQANVSRSSPPATTSIVPGLLHQLKEATSRQARPTFAALMQATKYVSPAHYFPRREIALARFSLTLARLEGAPLLLEEHVEEAAEILGLTRQLSDQSEGDEPDYSGTGADHPEKELPISLDTPHPPISERPLHTQQTQLAQLPTAIHSEKIGSATICSEDPYPEDIAPIEREAASLQLSTTHFSSTRSARGPIIGIEESDTFQDLAITSTILAALRFKNVSHQSHNGKSPGFTIEHRDLRRYRRGSVVENVLMILLDYTSIRDHVNWSDALLPYLRKAYADRASIVLIKVGSELAASELQAEVISARNILVPRIGQALDEGSGKASPLAHGFLLAQEQLRHLLQHGRDAARRVTFVVISDGRGNVPRAASLKNQRLNTLIGREGIEDALQEAALIRAIRRVSTVVLDPRPFYYPELPGMLAQALGAELIEIPETKDEAEG